MSTSFRRTGRIVALIAGLASSSAAMAQVGTGFTYQGLLENAGTRVTTSTALEFRLFDAPVGGSQFGAVINANVTPDEGVFSVGLDFGVSPYTANDERWLEITVDGTTLSRQKLDATPFALNTRGLEVDAAGTVKVASSNVSAGNVDGGGGIFNNTSNFLRFLSNNDTKLSAGSFLRFWSQGAERVLILGNTTTVNNDIVANGTVGVGASSPSHRLTVIDNAPVNGVMRIENSNPDGFSGIYFSRPGGGFDGYVGVTVGPGTWIGGESMQIGSGTGQDVVVTTGSASRMRVQAGGNVGIGTDSPGFRLEVNGSAGKPGGGSWTNSSDRRLKKNIAPIEGALETVLALEGVTYEYKDADAIHELPGERIGFIAQDVERVIPDWIDEGDDGYKRLTVRGFEALAVEAIREQQNQIDQLRAELDAAQSKTTSIRATLAWPIAIGLGLLGGFAIARRRGGDGSSQGQPFDQAAR